jgi:kynurenine formamidase
VVERRARAEIQRSLPVFENVANLRRLPAQNFFFVGLPMKIDKRSGGPLRAMAIVPRR